MRILRRQSSLALLLVLLLPSPLFSQNLLVNSGFNTDLVGWDALGAMWSNLDSNGSPSSGSAKLSTAEFEIGFLVQCIPIQSATRFELSAAARIAGGQPPGDAVIIVGWYRGASCFDAGEEDFFEEALFLEFTERDQWVRKSVLDNAPAGAAGAFIAAFVITDDPVEPPPTPLVLEAFFDDIVLRSDTGPRVSASTLPGALVQDSNGGATTSYVLQNFGFTATDLTISKSGSFFTQSPTNFRLEPGASQVITITGLPVAPGAYDGQSIPMGAGVPAGLTIPVRLLSTLPAGGPVNAAPVTARVDLSADVGETFSTGTVDFVNSGSGTLTGIVISDAAWLIPPTGLVTIPPFGRTTITFTIDRSKRPDSGSLGSVSANLFLVYPGGTGGTSNGVTPLSSTPTTLSPVTVVDTVRPGTSPSSIPPLGPDEVALFAPGVGHIVGSVGLFLSDISLLNVNPGGSLKNLQMFYTPYTAPGTPAATTLLAPLSQLVANQPLLFGDLTKSVFGNNSSVGSLQIRTADPSSVSVSASVFVASNPKGTYGTSIPIFRSDRSASAGQTIVLPGLRKDSSGHTNLYLQETSGAEVTANIDLVDASGATIGTLPPAIVGPYRLLQLGASALPEGAVAALVTPSSSSAGKLAAFATPVDRASGDTWAIADWNRKYATLPNEPVIIPVAGARPGANNTYFRTDVAITNSGTTTSSGTLRYYSTSGAIIDRTINLAPRASRLEEDVVVNLFGAAPPTIGYLVYTPASGSAVLTSRTYTTVIGSIATFGSAVPAIPISQAFSGATVRKFGGIDDASAATISAQRPGTFRTNFGFVETSGQPAKVRVTIRYTSGTQTVEARAVAFKEFDLNPRQFLLDGPLALKVIGPSRDTSLGDLKNIQVEFQVVGGTGSVVVFTSSVDNGTGDSIIRTE